MKKIGKIIFIIGIVLLIIAAIFIINQEHEEEKKPELPSVEDEFENKKIEEIQTEDKTKGEINELVEALFSSDVTKTKLENLTDSHIPAEYVYYGKDAYIRNLGSEYKGVDEYHRKRDEYAKILESYIKDNFTFEIKEYIVSADGAIVQRSSYRTYYYIYFIKDLSSLTSELYAYSDLDMEELVMREPTKEEQIKMYKLRIKALEIMSNYFDNYINHEEIIEYDLIYKKEDKKIRNDYYSLLINFAGEMYKNEKLNDTNRKQRVKGYISDAISSGQLDTSNPYKLK